MCAAGGALMYAALRSPQKRYEDEFSFNFPHTCKEARQRGRRVPASPRRMLEVVWMCRAA